MSKFKDKYRSRQKGEQNYQYNRSDRNPAEEELECWASDSGSSSGSYYSNSSR